MEEDWIFTWFEDWICLGHRLKVHINNSNKVLEKWQLSFKFPFTCQYDNMNKNTAIHKNFSDIVCVSPYFLCQFSQPIEEFYSATTMCQWLLKYIFGFVVLFKEYIFSTHNGNAEYVPLDCDSSVSQQIKDANLIYF